MKKALFQRSLNNPIKASFSRNDTVTLVYGPRQAGKTTLLRELMESVKSQDIAYFSGDDAFVQEIFGNHTLAALKKAVGGKEMIVIDEAQRIPSIGLSAKIIVDQLSVKVVLSGSSSFELSDTVSEPLTGRTQTFHLAPLSWEEVKESYRETRPEDTLDELLRFGMYPKVHTLEGFSEKEVYLYEYVSNYLSKDILAFGDVRKPKKVFDLLTLLALQVGSEVSVAELARALGIAQPTVERYLDILEKMFVIVNVRGFSRNLRKEVSKTSKYYFADVGVRNAIIRNMNPMHMRSDAGALFENWYIVERMKQATNSGIIKNMYFWRTYEGYEIDLIEEYDGRLIGYECKYGNHSHVLPPRDWKEAYPDAGFVPVVGTGVFDVLEEGGEGE